MNKEIAKKRYKEVLRVDVTTNSQADFLVTHLPFQNLHLATHLTNEAHLFDEDTRNDYTEEQVYEQIIRPSADDQFTLVIGTNGSGKSNLIRWFATTLRERSDENEAVLFVRRNDNTLKGTIKQLLNMPEINNLPHKEEYKRLANAAATVSEKELKDTLYHNYIIKMEGDDGIDLETGEHLISHTDKKRLIALMQNSKFKEHLMGDGGPIERIYSKLAESTTIKDSNIITEFLPEDFLIDPDFRDELINGGADRNAVRISENLIDDGIDSHEYAEKLTKYINSFNDEVIQKCAGLEPGDLRNIFTEIRQELYKQGKSLTILVEDITSFTGINSALLEALMTPHTGDYAADHMCRLNAIVGSTDGYYHDNFRDNYKERINHFVYVPDDLFEHDQSSLIEFFARYLNAISLPEETINEWVSAGVAAETYPIHVMDKDEYGELFTLRNGKTVSLYPFTRNAIKRIYSSLKNNKRTPRLLMQEVILPCVEDIIISPKSFPSIIINLGQENLRAVLQAAGVPGKVFERQLKFMAVWSNGTTDTYEKDGISYIGGIATPVYERLGLVIIDGKHIEAPSEKEDDKEPSIETTANRYEETLIDPSIKNRLDAAANELSHWASDKDYRLNFSNSSEMRDINQARSDINDYLADEIDWLSEGVPLDAALKFINASNGRFRRYLVAFERQNQQSNAVVTLPADNNTILLLESFIKWRLLGNKSWNYDGSYDDMLRTQIQIESIRPKIIKALMSENNKPIAYFNYSVAAELYRLIFNGYCKAYSDPKNFSSELLLNENPKNDSPNSHGKKWSDLKNKLDGPDGQSIHDIVIQYFNLPQGTRKSSDIIFLNRSEWEKVVRTVKLTGLRYTDEELQLDDPLPARKKSSEHLKLILERIDAVEEEEKNIIRDNLNNLSKYINMTGDISGEDIRALVKTIDSFYQNASDNHLSIMNHREQKLISFCKKYSVAIALSIKQEKDILETDDTIASLLKLSKDPVSHTKPFVTLLANAYADNKIAEQDIQNRMSKLNDTAGTINSGFVKEETELNICKQILQEAMQDAQ